MATIFLDQFSGTGSINGHMPDVGLPNAEWSDNDAPPTAQLSGGHLVAPEAGVTRIASYEYLVMGESQPIDLPLEGSYIITFRTGPAAALDAAGAGTNLFAFTIRDNDGSTVSIRTSSSSGIFILQGPVSSAFLDLLPETTYTLTWIYQANLDRFISSSNPGNTLLSIPSTRTSAPEGFAFALTQLADIDELQVTDDVPPLPAEPADYLYDDFTGDGPMEGRTPDFTAIPGVTWTDTSLAGSAETLDGNMVVGSGVPTDGVASARYGNFATAMGGPLTGDIYSEFATGPDLSYPMGATGPVTLVEFRFSVSPGEPLAVTVVVNPDDSFSVLYGDMQTAPITLTTDNIYFLYLNYLETEHYVELFDNNLAALAFSDTYAYTPTNPSAGYGATELSVNERTTIAYYEVFGLLQEQIVNDTDGMDDGVAEDATDTLNLATEDVVEAGVGEDYPLLDGEVLPEDVREAGIGADMAGNQLDANQDALDGGVGADTALPTELPADGRDAGLVYDANMLSISTAAFDEGVAEDMADPLGGVLLYFDDAVSDGVADDATNTTATRNANGLAAGIAADFAPNDYYALPRDNGVAADATNTTLRANQIAVDAGVADATTDTRILEDAVATGVAADTTSLAVSLTVRDDGVATDRALSSMTIAADVREAGVAADAALPLSFVDVREAGIAADVLTTQRRTSQAARSDGVAADLTDPRLTAGALAVSAGVAVDATSTQLVAYSMVIEAGVGDDSGLFGRLYEAWVMNTQNTAMSRYTSLSFNSAAVIGGRVIGLGDGGFFELGGTTDAGKQIKALMKSGHLTLQDDKIKRLDDVTVGYTSTGTLQVTVGAYGGKLTGRWTYTAPPVAAVSPRGNRLTLGRGLQAKYYQFTIENTKGAAMSLDFARVISNEFKSRRF